MKFTQYGYGRWVVRWVSHDRSEAQAQRFATEAEARALAARWRKAGDGSVTVYRDSATVRALEV